MKRQLVALGVLLIVLLSLVTGPASATGEDSFPKTRRVPDGKGGFRIEVVDRPFNGTPGANDRARTQAMQRAAERAAGKEDSSGDVSILGAGTDYTPPTTIRVGIGADQDPDNPIARVDTVTFYAATGTNDYLQNVLPNEWPCLWDAEAVKTGAMAAKMHGWYHTMYPKFPLQGADVDNTKLSQVYIAGTAHSSCTSAIRTLHGQGLRRYWHGQPDDAYVFETAYCAGFFEDDKLIPCDNYSVGDYVTQNGSSYWAEQGKTYTWILDYYYDPPMGDTQGFFSY